MAHWNRLFTCLPIHSMVIFHCYVSLPEGTSNPSDLSSSLLFDASNRGANPPCSDTPMTHVCNYRFPVKLRGAGNKSIYAEYDSDESLILPGHQKYAVLQSISFKNMIQNLSTVLDEKIFPSFPVHKCRTLMRIGMKSVVAGLPRRPCLPNAAETMTYVSEYISKLKGVALDQPIFCRNVRPSISFDRIHEPTAAERQNIYALMKKKKKKRKINAHCEDDNYSIWLVLWNLFVFSISYGMSSFPLTKSIIFQDGFIAPPTSIYYS